MHLFVYSACKKGKDGNAVSSSAIATYYQTHQCILEEIAIDGQIVYCTWSHFHSLYIIICIPMHFHF